MYNVVTSVISVARPFLVGAPVIGVAPRCHGRLPQLERVLRGLYFSEQCLGAHIHSHTPSFHTQPFLKNIRIASFVLRPSLNTTRRALGASSRLRLGHINRRAARL